MGGEADCGRRELFVPNSDGNNDAGMDGLSMGLSDGADDRDGGDNDGASGASLLVDMSESQEELIAKDMSLFGDESLASETYYSEMVQALADSAHQQMASMASTSSERPSLEREQSGTQFSTPERAGKRAGDDLTPEPGGKKRARNSWYSNMAIGILERYRNKTT